MAAGGGRRPEAGSDCSIPADVGGRQARSSGFLKQVVNPDFYVNYLDLIVVCQLVSFF